MSTTQINLGVQDVLVVNEQELRSSVKDLTVVLPELETVEASGKI